MAQLLRTETQYYFDLTNKQWWVMPKSDDEWKELPNEEAYKLGLFKAVLSQKCNFIDTDVSEYDLAVSDLVKELEYKFDLNKHKSKELSHRSSGQVVGTVLTKDFSTETNPEPQETAKSDQDQEFSESPDRQSETESRDNLESSETPAPKDGRSVGFQTEVSSKDNNGGSQNLLSQINNLIESTSQMKQIVQAKEKSAQNKNTPNLRSTARHLTYVNNGGLAGCLKTVAEERKKMCNSKKPVPVSQNSQLQEMIQRAKAMAAKTMDDVKEQESAPGPKKGPPEKKTQLRSNVKKYTTVFGAAALKDLRLNQNLPDVTFEGSSDDNSDEDSRNNNNNSGSKDKSAFQRITRGATLGR